MRKLHILFFYKYLLEQGGTIRGLNFIFVIKRRPEHFNPYLNINRKCISTLKIFRIDIFTSQLRFPDNYSIIIFCSIENKFE